MKVKSTSVVLGSAVTLAAIGCKVGPNYQEPQMHPPAKFLAASTQPSTTQPTTQPVEAVDLERWWESFHDPALNRLIAEGIR